MGMDYDNIQITIEASAKTAEKQVDELSQKLNILAKALENSGKSAKTTKSSMYSFSENMKAMFSGISRMPSSIHSMTTAIRRAVISVNTLKQAFEGVQDVVKGTADYIESYNYFNVSLGKIASDWKEDYQKFGFESADEYAKSFQRRLSDNLRGLTGLTVDVDASGKGLLSSTNMKNLGLNIQEVTQYASQLASVTNSVGQTGETSLATANAFAKLAGDISSLFNVDYSTVAKNLQSGLIGQSRALYKYGIDITNATLQTKAYELGIEKTVAEMTQAEKMQLRIISVLEQSKVSYGDLANTLNSPANMMRQLANNTKEAGLVLGQIFLPIIEELLPKINGFVIATKNVLVNTAQLLGIEIDFSSFGQGYDESAENIDGVTDSLDNFTTAAKKAKYGIRAFDELNVIGSGASSSIGIADDILKGSMDLTDEILKATGEYNSAWKIAFNKAQSEAQNFADEITPKIQGVVDVAGKLEPVFKGALAGIVAAFSTYQAVKLVEKLASGVALLARPEGWAVLTVAGIAAIGAAIWDIEKDRRAENLASHFGDISLSMGEIETIAQRIVTSNNLDTIKNVFNEFIELDNISSQIGEAEKVINKINWKVSVGVGLDEGDEKNYKDAIENYISGIEQYSEQQHYAASLGIDVFLDSTQEDVQATINEYYNEHNAEIAELGGQLRDAVNESWNDGLLTIDEIETIRNIQSQLASVQKKLADERFAADVSILEFDYNTSDLNAESFKRLLNRSKELLEGNMKSLNDATASVIMSINVAYESKINKASTQAARDAVQKEWDAAIAEIEESWNSEVREMYTTVDKITQDAFDRFLKDSPLNAYNSVRQEYLSKSGGNPKLALERWIKDQRLTDIVEEMREISALKESIFYRKTNPVIDDAEERFALNLKDAKDSMSSIATDTTALNTALQESELNSGLMISKLKDMKTLSGNFLDNIKLTTEEFEKGKKKIDEYTASYSAVLSQFYVSPKKAVPHIDKIGPISLPGVSLTSLFNVQPVTQNTTQSSTNTTGNIETIIENATKKGTESAIKEIVQSGTTQTNVNVTLQGDAAGMFKVIQNQANQYFNATGNSAFAY